MSGSVSFDRAAGYYDETRSLSPRASRAQANLLASELRAGAACLEIGVGTGRIALPLHERGVALVGVDLSRPMLDVLIQKAGGAIPFPLALADATALPFRDARFGAAVASHVLHLVSDVEEALDELLRVVRPGGRILLDLGGGGGGTMGEWWRDGRRIFREAAGLDPRPEGPELRPRVDARLRSRGAVPKELEPVSEVRRITPEEGICHLERGLYSYTWGATDEQRRRGAEALRAAVKERLGSLTQPVEVIRTIEWLAYDLPAGGSITAPLPRPSSAGSASGRKTPRPPERPTA